MPLITVLPPSKGLQSFDTSFALQQDNWNDYGFKTRYLLYRSMESGERELIGAVKIVKKGQTATDQLQLNKPFDRLKSTFISMGESLDYYQRLNELETTKRDKLLRALQDVVAHPDRRAEFQDEPGWNTSLFRGGTESGLPLDQQDNYLRDAAAIYSGNFTDLPDLGKEFEFTPFGWSEGIDISYDAPSLNPFVVRRSRGKKKQPRMPKRCLVLIGRNGSGKTTLLSKLARVAYASPTERREKDIEEIGVFEPFGIGFMRIITIAYSAFDSFTLPGIFVHDLEQIAKDIDRGEGRFIYSGLRDVAKELREDLENLETALDSDSPQRLRLAERRSSTHLKSLDQLADEFVRLYKQIEEKNRIAIFDKALLPVLSDSSFADFEEPDAESLLGENPKETFLSWSTGHKITLHVLASIVAHAEKQSLVLFDEPETHLHPPLVAALMHGVRIALEETEAFSIIATHSPVVLQETLATHVRIIERHGAVTRIHEPSGETYGENIGTLVYDTFGLTATATDFHDLLDHLIDTEESIEDIDAYFTPALSAQARAYVLQGMASKLDDEE